MREILPLYAGCVFLAYLSHRNSRYDWLNARYIYKERLFFTLLTVIAVVFAGLRTNYNDTLQYLRTYRELSIDAGWLSGFAWDISRHPLFHFMSRVIKSIGFSENSFLMTCAGMSIGVYLWFIYRYSNDLTLSVFLYFAMGCFVFAMGAIKQCIATGCCLIGIDRLLGKKSFRTLRFLFWVTIGLGFHPFSAMFYVCPFLMFSPWSLPTVLMIIICAIAGYSMQTWLARALDLLSVVGIEYDEAMALKDSVNIFRVLVVWAPVLLSLFTAKFWRVSKNKEANLLMNLSTLCAELMLFALFGNPIYFGRVANYFLLFQAISLPFTLKFFDSESKLLIKLIAIFGYSGYAYYREVIAGGSFDKEFSSISIWQYLGELF